MKNYLNNLPKEVLDLIYLAREITSRNNIPIYLVGGFVRDLLLGVKNLDLDIVVEGNGIKFAEDFARTQKAKLIRHRRFGTATVIIKPHLKIDVASARKEFYPQPAHLPVVSSGTLKDDLARRDFTINAMAISIERQDFGRLIDFFKGAVDLENRNIRILHNLSFIDDPTRILRAIRFEKRYNFKIELQTLRKLKEAVSLRMLNKLEPQRIRDDLILMLKEEHPLREIKRLQELSGFGFLSPRLAVSQRIYTLLHSVEKQINWFRETCPQRRHLDAWLIYFMGLVEKLDINEIKRISRRFAFRKGEEKRVLAYKKNSRKIIQVLNRDKIKPSKVFALLEPLSYETLILLKAKYKSKRIQRHIADFFTYYNGVRICVSGRDLHRLGLPPGPRYQKIFAKVLNAKLDGKAETKEEELEIIRKLIKNK